MATLDAKAMVRRIFEQGMNQKNSMVFDELIAPNYVNHNMPAPAPGADGVKQVVGMFTQAYPDFKITLRDVLGEGDKVSTRGAFTGTHNGDFMGIKATGKRVEVEYIDIWRVQGGRFVENWVQIDMMGMMQQLGVAQAPLAQGPSATRPPRATGRGGTPSPEKNRATIRRLAEELWIKGKVAIIDELFASDWVDHNAVPGTPPGREGWKQFAAASLAAFTGARTTVDDLLVDGDKAVWRWSFGGKQTGAFMGIPATGKHATLAGITIDRLAEGKLVERWSVTDTMGMLQQLGVIPAPAR